MGGFRSELTHSHAASMRVHGPLRRSAPQQGSAMTMRSADALAVEREAELRALGRRARGCCGYGRQHVRGFVADPMAGQRHRELHPRFADRLRRYASTALWNTTNVALDGAVAATSSTVSIRSPATNVGGFWRAMLIAAARRNRRSSCSGQTRAPSRPSVPIKERPTGVVCRRHSRPDSGSPIGDRKRFTSIATQSAVGRRPVYRRWPSPGRWSSY